jgi:hypothetical protein
MNKNFRCHSGRFIDPFDLEPDDIDINDIAHHSALINRWAGTSKFPRTLAAHSRDAAILVRQLGGTWHEAMGALLHDATEALGMQDISRSLKSRPEFKWYRAVEDQMLERIYRKFNLPFVRMPEIVHFVDEVLLRCEAEVLFEGNADWVKDFPTVEDPPEIRDVSWVLARNEFLIMYYEILYHLKD